MPQRREWFWKIKDLGQGPDYVFRAAFESGDAQRLAALVQCHLPTHFVRNRAFLDLARCNPHQAYEQYLDTDTHDKLLAKQRGEAPQSIWFNGSIEVLDQSLVIHNVLAGEEYGETDLIVAIARAPDVTLQHWCVAYGGDGYAGGEAAQGNSAAELLDYLGLAPEPAPGSPQAGPE